MEPSYAASKVYNEAVVVDGLNVSNWESPAVFDSLSKGGVTAINATIAVWEGYAEAMDNVAAWIRRFGERERTSLRSPADRTSWMPSVAARLVSSLDGRTPRLSRMTWTGWTSSTGWASA